MGGPHPITCNWSLGKTKKKRKREEKEKQITVKKNNDKNESI